MLVLASKGLVIAAIANVTVPFSRCNCPIDELESGAMTVANR
jgi:hypothetical protein